VVWGPVGASDADANISSWCSEDRDSEQEARDAIVASLSYAEALRRLGMRAAGGNWRTLRKYAEEVWSISTDHFDPGRSQNEALRQPPKPLSDVLIRGSTYSRGNLKRRLFEEGLKRRVCEMCVLREIQAIGYSATGRRYGVSDNAIRKWLRQYECERAARKSPSGSVIGRADV
jgi:hypothetical protein